ncbi:MAG: AAA family ATPase [bacterium]|nr:AAA family ATPase [bacterium]
MTQAQVLNILKTGVNVFLTGEPGSGKTYTINQYVSYLQKHGIAPAVTASTGIAATHIGGMTMHSWSGIGIKQNLNKYELDRIASNKYVYERVNRTKVLIIDEVSMLSADTLAMVDRVCREIKRNELPFGGLQVVFVGDFFQLPPVQKELGDQSKLIQQTKRFAFESQSWQTCNPVICYLTEQHRQEDRQFLALLCAIRDDQFGSDHLVHLEKRIVTQEAKVDNIPKLFSHNVDVDRVNDQQLNKLAGKSQTFVMDATGRSALIETLKKSCLSPEKLVLKPKAAVMFTKNNPKAGFVNGTLGVVERFDSDTGFPVIKTRSGKRIHVEPADWTIEDNGRILASVTQFPLRLAWAITVHKSQGMSLDAAVMDLRQVFEFGQGYVALSRVRSLAGIYLHGWNDRTFQVHPTVLAGDKNFRQASAQAENRFAQMPSPERQQLYENFIRASGGKVEIIAEGEYARHKKSKPDTYQATLVLWKTGKTAALIAKARGLTEQTVLGHIEKLSDSIPDPELQRLLTPAIAKSLSVIHSAFDELGIEKLSPVFKKFKGKYSYNDIRVAKILFRKN